MEEVFPQIVFKLFNVIPVRDTVIFTWIMMAFTLVAVCIARRFKPEALEMFIDFVSDIVSDLLGRPAEPFLPLLGALMLYLLLGNNLGLLPMLASPMKDVNTPLALALVVFFAVHYYGIREQGVRGYFKSLSTPFFMLLMEAIGQVSRTMALALRLFGNVLSSEFIVIVIFSLVKPVAPLLMMFIGAFSSVLQAYIFVALASNYIAAALGAGKK